MSNEPFGFVVARDRAGDWAVSLPHQCDRWDIVGDSLFGTEGEPHANAVARMRSFVAQAQAALAALEAGQEWKP